MNAERSSHIDEILAYRTELVPFQFMRQEDVVTHSISVKKKIHHTAHSINLKALGSEPPYTDDKQAPLGLPLLASSEYSMNENSAMFGHLAQFFS